MSLKHKSHILANKSFVISGQELALGNRISGKQHEHPLSSHSQGFGGSLICMHSCSKPGQGQAYCLLPTDASYQDKGQACGNPSSRYTGV
ncbi:hypothetical protein ABBQ32_001580 [Trebouxia sp. C0010 RCD-2024]